MRREPVAADAAVCPEAAAARSARCRCFHLARWKIRRAEIEPGEQDDQKRGDAPADDQALTTKRPMRPGELILNAAKRRREGK